MKYFALEFSLNEKITGKIPQVKEYIHHCDVYEEHNFIDRFYFRKIEGTPILSNIVMYPNARLTDIIDSGSSIGFSNGSIILSSRFKELLEQFNCYGLQFFPTYVIHKNQKFDNYWQTHVFGFPYEYIDFKKTNILLQNSENRKIVSNEPLEISNSNELNEKIISLQYPFCIYFDNIFLIEDVTLDYFQLRFFENGGYHGIVSERLKKAIEKEKITGIEFKPIELSLQDWYHSGEREKIYGKSY